MHSSGRNRNKNASSESRPDQARRLPFVYRVGLRQHSQSVDPAPHTKTKAAPVLREPPVESYKNRLFALFGHFIGVEGGNLLIGGAQILVRIHRNIVDAHFIVKVWSSGAARLAHIANDLT